MTIRKKITTSFILSLIVASLVFILFYAYAQRIARIQEQRAAFNQIMRETLALNVISTNYIVNPNRIDQQDWIKKYQALKKDIEQLTIPAQADSAIIDGMLSDLQAMETAFLDVSRQNRAVQLQENITATSSATFRLFEQLFIRAELIIASALELDRLASYEVLSTTTTRGIVSLGGMTLLALVIIGNFLLLSRVISRRLASVVDSTNQIAKGNLDVRLQDVSQKDEIGQLARAFNQMTGELKTLYEGLEQKVRERTAELAEAKAKDEAILRSMGDGLIVTDKERNILLANQAAQTMLGISRDEMHGKWPDILGEKAVVDDEGKPIESEKLPIYQALKHGKTIRVTDYSYSRKGGPVIPVAITASPVILERETIGAAVIFRDIIEERAIDKAKTEFVSLASHQLRTPLSTIRWYTELLRRSQKNLSTKQKIHLEEIYTSNLRLIQLVNALLSVSRIELGTFMVEPEEIDLVKLTQDVLREVRLQIQEKKLQIVEKYEKLPQLLIDPALTRMVLQNIIGNAVKYTPHNDSITIELKVVKKGKNINEHKLKKDSVLIIVTDTGYGIPKHQHNQVFSKLFRADNVRKIVTTGTGLGLYIAKSIVDHSEGEIWFTSQENQGTTFYVSLPLSGMKQKKGNKPLMDS